MTEDPVPAADSTNDASEALRSRPKIQLRSILFEPTTEDEQTEHTDLESRPSNPLLAPAGVPGSELPPLQSRIQSAPHPNDPQPALDARTNIVPTPTESPNSVAPQLSADATVASSTQDGGGSNAGANKGSRGKTMVPLKKRDAKGLCSDDWCKLNPTGTISQFNTYWNTIKDTPAAECYAPLGNPKPASRARRTTRQSGM
ncbi:hypothetical protein M413DRAFT_447576 [Hebeloma cylindrosporum]|uniref:Uncharacterized protein n=1 Tax=Hebeloma cylindrosporum TaxID=76867 RepID=A0A0C3C3N6_HEBCY|nr:hypothetical protein M413DRAFT_447576 [Hebeloma cylindrosporum h7]